MPGIPHPDDPTLDRRKRQRAPGTGGPTPGTGAVTRRETLADSARQTAASTAANLRQYRLGDELGRGGMGEVRAAIDNELRRQVAIKLLRSPGSANDAT
ncbi:MAG: hypothetical protein AB7K09_17070, partial [Planctomycetota bacterium]